MGERLRRRARGVVLAGVLLPVVGQVSGCSVFGGDDDSEGVSVFSVGPGQCFAAPAEVVAQVSDLDRVACDRPHDRELYARVTYAPPGAEPAADGEEGADDGSGESAPAPADDAAFPGDDALNAFAQAACAREFGPYVGREYLDSSLFFTYLVPSPRSWQDADRDVLCFANAAGEPLDASVKDSGR